MLCTYYSILVSSFCPHVVAWGDIFSHSELDSESKS